jgi:selenocysteine-specific elongation factor
MHVIGTAGHVDHGKSTLIAALTGIHPDRLLEEQQREMTIDLGFAWLTLPDGEEVGIVDVPGHRDFIENMLAGIGGIDAVMFVIACDEGVMPQTREHLAIIDLLQIPGGVIALTKIDLVDDPEWISMIEADIHEVTRGTVLESAPIVHVSSRRGDGLDELKNQLAEIIRQTPPRVDLKRPRLPVDRVFTMAGFGTVVTGTLSDGKLHVGDEVVVLPKGLKARIRGLQTHKRKEDEAIPGSRTAINLSGIDISQVKRGDIISLPGLYQATTRFDVNFRLLKDVSASLKHNMKVKLFAGATAVIARVRLLGEDELKPDTQGWLQLETEEPVVVARGDHFLLRRPSPGETLGGGVVANPHPEARYKRFSGEVLKNLEKMIKGSPTEILLQAAIEMGAAPQKELISRSRLSSEEGMRAADELLDHGELIWLDVDNQSQTGWVIPRIQIEEKTKRLMVEIDAFHRANPLRQGAPREELRSRLKISGKVFLFLLQSLMLEGKIAQNANLVWNAEHQIRFSNAQKQVVDKLLNQFIAAPYAPPTIKECQDAVGKDVYFALIDLDWLVPMSEEVVFRREDYIALLMKIEATYGLQKPFTIAEIRDLASTSRRYALAFLEHMDEIGLTVRQGDARKLKKLPSQIDLSR